MADAECSTCHGHGYTVYPTTHPTNPNLDGWGRRPCPCQSRPTAGAGVVADSGTPTVAHDRCEGCVYLGPFGDEAMWVGELWFCDGEREDPTVMIEVADAIDPVHGMEEPNASLPWAIEARKRATRRGLL